MNLLLVFAGGGAGSVIRYLLWMLFPYTGGFPVATLLANGAASILLAVLLLFPSESTMRLLLITGFCGGLSTFSTFSLETVTMARQGQWSYVILSITLNIIICFAAIYFISRPRIS